MKKQPQFPFPFADRLTLISFHYLFGPLLGFRQRIFAPDRNFRSPDRLLGLGLYFALWVGVLAGHALHLPLLTLGFLLIALSPQWVYALLDIQHTIFEYRAAQMPLGVALIIGQLTMWEHQHFGTFIIAAVAFGAWIGQTQRRNRLFSSPLLFWRQAHLDTHHDPLILSAYLYQLQKAEQFSTVTDIQKWMLEEQIPDCRALLINLAAAKFGSKSDNATLDQTKLGEAEALLAEVVRRWPDHADGWRNLGTVQYYQNRIPVAESSFSRALMIDSHDSLSWLCLGHCYLSEERPIEAVNCLRHAYNYLPAGAYLVEDISLVRVKLMEALEKAFIMTGDENYHQEFNQHQIAFEKDGAYFVTEENAPFIV